MSKVLVVDCDSAVYACGFMAQHKTWYAIYKGKVVQTETNKLKLNKWAKEQEEYPQNELEYKFTETLDTVNRCLESVDNWLQYQMVGSGCKRKVILLTKGGNCFRTHRAVRLRYKGNRVNTPKPHYYDRIRSYLRKLGGKMYAEVEADDVAAMMMHKKESNNGEPYVLCAIDKDLDQVAGLRWNPNHNKPDWCKKNNCHPEGVFYQEADEGWWHFYMQMLTGDRVDNIPGIPGVGEARARQALEGCYTPAQMCRAVMLVYKGFFGEGLNVTPWWAEKEEDEYIWKDELAAQFREERGVQPLQWGWQDFFREAADLLYMLRTKDDQYGPHYRPEELRWEIYSNGTVSHSYGRG